MTKMLSDSRTMTLVEADQLMHEISDLEIEVVKISATKDKQINKIKEGYESMTKPLADSIKVKAALLNEFITNNPGLFIKPKSRVTAFGKYGKRNVTKTEITDDQLVINFGKLHNMPIYKTSESVDKTAVKNAIEAGNTIPGAKVSSGTENYYTVTKELLDTAKQNILSD